MAMTSEQERRLELWKDFFNSYQEGRFSENDKRFYMQNMANEYEKKIGKPMFAYTNHERLIEQMYRYNQSEGNEKRFCCEKCKHRGYFASVQGDYFSLVKCECLIKLDSTFESEKINDRRKRK